MKCNHKWIDAKDGTRDKICIKCDKRAMQGVLSAPITNKVNADIAMPVGREKVKFPLYTGEKTAIIEVYKDDLIKEFSKSLNLSMINGPKAGG